jgi:hypothetical protein
MLTWLSRLLYRRRLLRLAKLQRDTDEILADAPKSLGGAVNWGDLSCWRALEWWDDSSDHGLAVEISEASPDADELVRYVGTELLRRGWPNVEVRTGW